ncbi:hypothetical protein IFM89_036856 [Coptis chinensis]|uniref:Purple acid phosphatase C-terminal domain-containing protein n=1 Tax=Coptis chinensis TaxID=261450 RepID=A0A835HHJ8_9MAGN|nr:hypothetical protein IFM89_036856 [Coptis chinensis]
MGNTGMVYHPPAWFRERMILIMTVEISLIAYFVVYRSNSEINRNLFGKEWLDTHPLVKELGRKRLIMRFETDLYSIKRASGDIIVLSSYSAYGKYIPQYVWLQNEVLKGENFKYSIQSFKWKLHTSVKLICTGFTLQSGDGGNIEGLANKFTEPQPSYSAYREASFGHAMLEIKNQTHAFYSWHRNQDSEAVLGDSQWFYNRQWYPHEESSTAGTVA